MTFFTNLNPRTPIAVIAAGRLGSSLALAMDDKGYNVVAASSRRASHRYWLSSHLEGLVTVGNAQAAVNLADVIFITAPDNAIVEICSSIDWRSEQVVLHCAGALPVKSLNSSADQGAIVGGFHPLQTFPTPDSADRLEGVCFAIEADELSLQSWLQTLALNLGGSSIQMSSGQRAAYHASAVMACGLLTGLSGLAAEMWAPLGIDRDEALKRLMPLIRATVEALDEQGLPSAMTGPFVRGDVQTVATHLAAINNISADVGRAYAALAYASLHIAREQGGVTDHAFERITSVLSLED